MKTKIGSAILIAILIACDFLFALGCVIMVDGYGGIDAFVASYSTMRLCVLITLICSMSVIVKIAIMMIVCNAK